MVEEVEIYTQLIIGIVVISGIADILFIWILHYTSTHYPKPSNHCILNEFEINNHHECCDNYCNEDLSRCLCGLRCRKIKVPMKCNCFYPLILFVPHYPKYYFTSISIENIKNIKKYANIPVKELELKKLKDDTDDDTSHNTITLKDEEKDISNCKDELDTEITDPNYSIANLKLSHDPYGKCCCCFFFSIAFRLWFLLCGILSITVFLIFAFSMFFEYIVKCLTWKNGSFLGILVAIFIISKIFIWFLYNSLHAIYLLWYNQMDLNNILIVEWFRMWQIFWCIMFSIMYVLSIDPQILSDAIFIQYIARFMLIQGILFIIIYWIISILSSIWIILNLFHLPQNIQSIQILQDYIDPYKWKWIKNNNFCLKYTYDNTQKLQIFEHQTNYKHKLTLINFLFGIRGEHPKIYIYIQYIFVILLLLIGIVFVIVGYILGTGAELMLFTGWSLLIYYVLIILIKRDDYEGIIFKMWNGKTYKKIYYLLKEISFNDKYYSNLVNNQDDNMPKCDILTLRFMDIWSLIHNKQHPNYWSLCCGLTCFCKRRKTSDNTNTRNPDYDDNISMFNVKQFNFNLWCSILILFIPFAIIIWARTEYTKMQLAITQFDSKHRRNFSASSIGHNQYPFCSTSPVNGYLNAYDLIWLAQTGKYVENRTLLKMNFNAWFDDNDIYDEGWDYDNSLVYFVPRSYELEWHPTVYYIENIFYNIHLVVVRGSYTAADWLQDIILWAQPLLIQAISFVIPINNLFDDLFLRDLVYFSSIFQGIIFPELRRTYDDPIYDFIVKYILNNKTKTKSNNSTIIITGHSLGAGVAQIVSSRLHNDGYGDGSNIISLGLSPPGTLWSSKKFGYHFNDLDVTSSIIIPRRDPFTMADKQGGHIQYIDCDAYAMWSCHSGLRSLCEFYYSCGNNIHIRNEQYIRCLCVNSTRLKWNNCTIQAANMSHI